MALALLLVLFATLSPGARELSLTIDEPAHIGSGYAVLSRGVDGLWTLPMRGHPLLVNAWEALPLFLSPPNVPVEEIPGWRSNHVTFVINLLRSSWPIPQVEVAGRTPAMLLTLLLAAVVFRWTADLWGPEAGVIALISLILDPTLRAHGRLATNDVGTVAIGTLALFLAWRWWRRAGWGRALALGAALAATMLAKASGVVWVAAFAGATALVGLTQRRRWPFWLQAALAFAVALLLLWAAYGFSVGQVGEIPVPLPAPHHWRLLLVQESRVDARPVFALGARRDGSQWWYFPLAFAIKNPLPFLMALAVSGATLLRRRVRLRRLLALGVFPLLYTFVAVAVGPNIGYRHMLPVHPFLHLLIGGGLVQWLQGGRRWRWALSIALVLWQAVSVASIAPHEISYFNELVGGAEGGWRYLADSNTDWGQTYKALAAYQERNDIELMRLSAFIFLDPAVYGVRYEPIAPMTGVPPVLPQRFNPPSGIYAISATTLDGVPLPLPATYDWFRHRSPQNRVAQVMFIYQVTERAGDWVAQCTDPVVPLPPEVIAEGFGSPNLRRITFDCRHSWVVPSSGGSEGWYIRSIVGLEQPFWPPGGDRHQWWPGWVQGLPLEALDLSYVQPTAGDLPPFAIWEWTGASLPPAQALEPVSLGGTLTFLGYELRGDPQPGEVFEVLTHWRVVDPPARPLSLMLHLREESGAPVAVGDGLGFAIAQWQPDDVIVQRHVLSLPTDTPPGDYRLVAGAYWLDDMTRLPAGDRPEIPLQTVTVR
jgi:4-amino-4-deoxy-L-arabinose transferase-like glycosyltransferase